MESLKSPGDDALNSDDDNGDDEDGDDNGDGDDDKKASGSDKYLVPLEVEAQFKLLWHHDGELLDFIWSRAVELRRTSVKADESRYSLFFQRVVLVPPNRFRPTSLDGGRESMHPHTVLLSRILEANDKIKRIVLEESFAS